MDAGAFAGEIPPRAAVLPDFHITLELQEMITVTYSKTSVPVILNEVQGLNLLKMGDFCM